VCDEYASFMVRTSLMVAAGISIRVRDRVVSQYSKLYSLGIDETVHRITSTKQILISS